MLYSIKHNTYNIVKHEVRFPVPHISFLFRTSKLKIYNYDKINYYFILKAAALMPISETFLNNIPGGAAIAILLKNAGTPSGDLALNTFYDTLVSPIPIFLQSFVRSVVKGFFGIL